MKRSHLFASFFASILALNASAAEPFDLFPGEDTIPILSWHCILPQEISVEHYQELKDCGFNLSFPHIEKFEDAQKALDCAAAVGIRTMFLCQEMLSCDTLEPVVRMVKDHPGLAGYHLRDEPYKKDIPEIKRIYQRIHELDPNHFVYLNLLPVGATDKFMPYEEYVHYCFTEIPTSFLSFDHYGIINNIVSPVYYKNLEVFLAESQKLNKPFWAFALATAHVDYLVPNKAQLKFQMYSNLAYGAQGLQYFTYWTPIATDIKFHDAPILDDGKRSSVYDMVREVNQELQNRNFVFMRSKVQWVRHTGDPLPEGTTKLTELPFMVTKLDTHGLDAVVSLLRKKDTFYLVIVNASIDKTMNLTVAPIEGVQRIRKDGTSVPASEYSENLILDAGECEVFAAPASLMKR